MDSTAVCRCSAGLGQIDHNHLEKLPPELGMLVVKIGGPAYRIGMGGGAASSVPSGGREGANAADLDFNAVQVRSVLSSRLTILRSERTLLHELCCSWLLR